MTAAFVAFISVNGACAEEKSTCNCSLTYRHTAQILQNLHYYQQNCTKHRVLQQLINRINATEMLTVKHIPYNEIQTITNTSNGNEI